MSIRQKNFSSKLSYTKCDLHEFGWLRDVNELEPTLLKTCIRVLISYDMTYLTMTKRLFIPYSFSINLLS